jgi:hypothetical protein
MFKTIVWATDGSPTERFHMRRPWRGRREES